MKKDQLLTEKETAEYLNVKVGTLRNWRVAGVEKGPEPTRVGGKVYYRQSKIEQYLEEQTGFNVESA